eukprot:UN34062
MIVADCFSVIFTNWVLMEKILNNLEDCYVMCLDNFSITKRGGKVIIQPFQVEGLFTALDVLYFRMECSIIEFSLCEFLYKSINQGELIDFMRRLKMVGNRNIKTVITH